MCVCEAAAAAETGHLSLCEEDKAMSVKKSIYSTLLFCEPLLKVYAAIPPRRLCFWNHKYMLEKILPSSVTNPLDPLL